MANVRNEIYTTIDSIYKENKMMQEELDALYVEEGVSSKSIRQQLIEAKEYLKFLEDQCSESAEERLMRLIFGSHQENEKNDCIRKEIKDQKLKIETLNMQAENFGKAVLKSMVGKNTDMRKYPSIELRNKVVLANLGIARGIAARYYKKNPTKYEFDDLFQIACLGLLSASYYYVPLGEAKFSTYASKCIENKLKRELYPKKNKKQSSGVFHLKEEQDKISLLSDFLKVLPLGGNETSFLRYLNMCISQSNKKHYAAGKGNQILKIPLRGLKGLKAFNDDAIARYDEFVDYFSKIVRQSHLNDLITDEERELVSMFANYKNVSPDCLDKWTLREYVKIYFNKLVNVIWYLEAESELNKENGDTPTRKEILDKLNKRVREYNSKMKHGINDYYYHNLKYPDNYIWEYYDNYDVDLFAEDAKEQREEEKWSISEDVRSKVNYWIDKYDDLLDEINELSHNSGLLIRCRVSSQTFGPKQLVCIEEYGDLELADDVLEFEVKELLSYLYNQLRYFNNDAVNDLVEGVLKERKENIVKIVKECNQSVFAHNKEVVEDGEDFSAFGKHKKKYNISDIDNIEEDIQVLFSIDDNLVESRIEAKRAVDLSIEDSVEISMFLEDYHNALLELTDVERNVLMQWFDEDGLHTAGAKEIGESLGITPKKVYREKEKALKKLAKNQIMQSYNEE